MQRNTIFFIVVKDLHVSGGFPVHHQELKNCTCSIWYLLSLVAATASVVEMELHGGTLSSVRVFKQENQKNVVSMGVVSTDTCSCYLAVTLYHLTVNSD
jgi:hypothetical protein